MLNLRISRFISRIELKKKKKNKVLRSINSTILEAIVYYQLLGRSKRVSPPMARLECKTLVQSFADTSILSKSRV